MEFFWTKLFLLHTPIVVSPILDNLKLKLILNFFIA